MAIGFSYLAERVEDGVEVDQDFAFGDLGNVVERFTCEVAYAAFLVVEAS